VLGAGGLRLASLHAAEVEPLIADGIIGSGMVPKVRFAVAALAGSAAGSVVIADGGAPHAVERALADGDFGTRIVADFEAAVGAPAMDASGEAP
jgi:acetylglutamate kinase